MKLLKLQNSSPVLYEILSSINKILIKLKPKSILLFDYDSYPRQK